MSSREKSHLTSEGFDRLIRGKSKEVIESVEHFVGCMPLIQSESPCQSSNRHSQQQRDNVPHIRSLIWQFREINNRVNVFFRLVLTREEKLLWKDTENIELNLEVRRPRRNMPRGVKGDKTSRSEDL